MIDPRKLGLPVKPLSSPRELGVRKPQKPAPEPVARWVTGTDGVSRKHWTASSGGCWVDEDSLPRHRGCGPKRKKGGK